MGKKYIQVEVLNSSGQVELIKIYDMKINFKATNDGIRYYIDKYFILKPYWIRRKDVEKMYNLREGVIEISTLDCFNINYDIKGTTRLNFLNHRFLL